MIIITNAVRLSLAPPHRFSYDTAETLSSRKSTVPPTYSGRSFSVICITNADTIKLINYSRLIVNGPACFVADCLLTSSFSASASE